MLPITRINAQLFGGMQYEPELFPGLIYRMKQPKIVLLIFVSGKVVLTGKLSIFCLRFAAGFWVMLLLVIEMTAPLEMDYDAYAGAKTRDQIYEAFEKIYPLLKQFKKGDVAAPAAVPSQVMTDQNLLSVGWSIVCLHPGLLTHAHVQYLKPSYSFFA